MKKAAVLIMGLALAFASCNLGSSPLPETNNSSSPGTARVKTPVLNYNAAAAIRYATSYYNNCYTDETTGACTFASDKIPFPDFDSDKANPKDRPGNCTNFFSQSLMASLVGSTIKASPTPQEVFDNRAKFEDDSGGYQWYIRFTAGISETWASAPNMEAYARNQNSPDYVGWNFQSLGEVKGNDNQSLLNNGKLRPGDVIFGALENETPNLFTHAMLVTQVDGCSIFGCSNDRNDDDRIKLTYQSNNQRNVSFLRQLRDTHPNSIFRAYRPISFRNGVQVALVIDDTGSMGGVIGSVKSSLTDYINAQPTEGSTLWSLFSFKDNVTDLGTTSDRATILSQVQGLVASGGNDCPENSLGALKQAAQRLIESESKSREIILATDAESQPGDVDGFLAFAKANEIKVNVLLAGTCGITRAATGTRATASAFPSDQIIPATELYSALARETGGRYFFLPGGSSVDFKQALDQIFDTVGTPAADTEAPVLSISVTPSVLFPPKKKLIEVVPTITVTDNRDLNPVVNLEGISIDESTDKQDKKRKKSKISDDDVQITADGRIYLRAERSGKAETRVYTLTYKATDAAGNSSFASATVVVPHDKGK
jgi:Putative amidase domain/von Willebrand factor type A domain